MEKELNKIIKNENQKMKTATHPALESSSLNCPDNLSFCGASILANLFKNNDKYWISKQDWDESGPNIILKKCKNINI